MKDDEMDGLVCPKSHHKLFLRDIERSESGAILSGWLECACGESFAITGALADLTYPRALGDKDRSVRAFYDGRADVYDANLPMTFLAHAEDETRLRNSFIDGLELKSTAKILEVACGTGRDSEIIAARLGPEGHLYMQDISPNMLLHCRQRMHGTEARLSFCLSNATHLPFADRFFDAVYSFGGLGEFSDIAGSLSEMVRVTKVGGKIVVGDESMPPWLRETEFGKILITTNKQFMAELPLRDIPVEARDFRLRYVLGGVFYLIDFRVGEGEPVGNFDFPIPGARGGTLRTRYHGQLEGVTPAAKALAEQARQKRGLSMHDWLDAVVVAAAKRDLGNG
jgi:ubiquinone/menaquinone biosynthesis C-methylase UbiE